jgi:hypothetical protein
MPPTLAGPDTLSTGHPEERNALPRRHDPAAVCSSLSVRQQIHIPSKVLHARPGRRAPSGRRKEDGRPHDAEHRHGQPFQSISPQFAG